MSPFLLTVIVVVAIVAGRATRRPTVERPARDWRLWGALTVFLLAINSLVSTVYIVRDNADLSGEQECRAELAAPVNDAIADISAGQGRGLVVFVEQGLDDPAFTELVVAKLGATGPDELRRQAAAILEASDALEEANDLRGDPVKACE